MPMRFAGGTRWGVSPLDPPARGAGGGERMTQKGQMWGKVGKRRAGGVRIGVAVL